MYRGASTYTVGESRLWYGALNGLLLLSLLWVTSVHGQINIATEWSQQELLIGDQVQWTIIVTHTEDITINGLDYAVLDELDNLEVLKAEQFDKTAEQGYEQTIITLLLTCWEEGVYDIPALPIRYRTAGTTEQTEAAGGRLIVTTLAVEQDSSRLMPIKNIVEEPLVLSDFIPYLVGFLLLVLLVTVAYYLYRRRSQKPPPPVPPRRLSLLDYTLEQLRAVEQRRLWEQGQLKAYYTELTYCLRLYLEQRYSFYALEATTGEVIDQLKARPELPSTPIIELLKKADLVKFAKFKPPNGAHPVAMETVQQFVRATANDTLIVEIHQDGRTNVKKQLPTPSEENDA